MPTTRYSTVFLQALAYAVDDEKGSLLQNPEALKTLGIDVMPGPRTTPKGLTGTASAAIATFWSSLLNQPDHYRFIETGTSTPAGRDAWRIWFNYHISKKVNKIVEECLMVADKHPRQILAAPTVTNFPPGGLIAGLTTDVVSAALFNEYSQDESIGMVDQTIAGFTKSIIVLNFERMKKAFGRQIKALEEKKLAAMAAMAGESY